MAEQMLHTEMSWGYDEMSWGHLPQVEQVQEEVGNAPDPGGEFRWGGPGAFSCGGEVVEVWGWAGGGGGVGMVGGGGGLGVGVMPHITKGWSESGGGGHHDAPHPPLVP